MAGDLPSPDEELHKVAERVGEEFRKSLAVITDPELVPYRSAQVDALYDLLSRGIIEPGPGAFA